MKVSSAAAIPVSIQTGVTPTGGNVIPVYGYREFPTDRLIEGGNARPVIVLADDDLNTGNYILSGMEYAIPVFTAPSDLQVIGGTPLLVYAVNPDEWPDVPTPPVTNWWEAGGTISCIAAYQPKGAASLAESYLNLENPGTYDASPIVAPTFNTATGWTFNGSTQYLDTGIVPAANMTFIVQFSGGGSVDSRVMFGGIDTGALSALVGFTPFVEIPPNGVAYVNGSGFWLKEVNMTDGNIAIAGNKAYRNGIDEGLTLGAWSGTPSHSIFIGARSFNGARNLPWSGTIIAWAAYSSVLSASQIAAISSAMAGL